MVGKKNSPSLWNCLGGSGMIGAGGWIVWDELCGPEELEVVELAGVAGLLCSGVATEFAAFWYPKKSPKSGTQTLSYKLAGTFSNEAFSTSTSATKNKEKELIHLKAKTPIKITKYNM